MSVVLVKNKVTPTDLAKATQDYGNYLKVVVDVDNGLMAIGGAWHADAEKLLLQKGSRQANLWGGGVLLDTCQIDTLALINLRPKDNPSQEILDPQIRARFIALVKHKFAL